MICVARKYGPVLMNAHARPPASLAEDNAGAWLKTLAKYRQPRIGRSVLELFVTAVPFAGFWAIAYFSFANSFWYGLIAIVPAAAFLLRLFMIQHDCGHGSFFARRGLDDWTGRVIGVLTLTPDDCSGRAHAAHHASAGNLDERGVGDITTLTVSEYRALSSMRRLGYHLYRHPLVMFGFGPAWLFLLKQRLPVGMMNGRQTQSGPGQVPVPRLS